ncbi:DNA-nicking Smr family endonuclease [Bradyrhizobium sp. USDA 4470]
MKRSSRPPVLEPRPPRRRVLTEEDRELWELVARQVKPLRKHRATKLHAAPRAEPSPVSPAAKPALSPRLSAAPPALRPSKPAMPPLAPLGKRERTKLSRGRSEIEARLDLHGMTQMRAHRALTGFLHRAHHDGLTFVLVITGKGRSGG